MGSVPVMRQHRAIFGRYYFGASVSCVLCMRVNGKKIPSNFHRETKKIRRNETGVAAADIFPVDIFEPALNYIMHIYTYTPIDIHSIRQNK